MTMMSCSATSRRIQRATSSQTSEMKTSATVSGQFVPLSTLERDNSSTALISQVVIRAEQRSCYLRKFLHFRLLSAIRASRQLWLSNLINQAQLTAVVTFSSWAPTLATCPKSSNQAFLISESLTSKRLARRPTVIFQKAVCQLANRPIQIQSTENCIIGAWNFSCGYSSASRRRLFSSCTFRRSTKRTWVSPWLSGVFRRSYLKRRSQMLLRSTPRKKHHYRRFRFSISQKGSNSRSLSSSPRLSLPNSSSRRLMSWRIWPSWMTRLKKFSRETCASISSRRRRSSLDWRSTSTRRRSNWTLRVQRFLNPTSPLSQPTSVETPEKHKPAQIEVCSLAKTWSMEAHIRKDRTRQRMNPSAKI